MNLWTLEHVSLLDQVSLLSAGDIAGQQEALDGFPHHLQRELLFPYTAGLDLICDRWLDGGWAAVDAAYDDLPPTTAAVLWPDRDPGPTDLPSLRAPADGTERSTETFGAAELAWLFEAPGDDRDRALDEPFDRAAAWAGGEVTVWDVDGSPIVGLALRDRDEDGPELCGSMTTWYAAAAPDAERDDAGDGITTFDDEVAAAIACDGDAVRLAFAAAPDVALAVVR